MQRNRIIILSTVMGFVSLQAFSQKEFFRSPQQFSESQLQNFYSSITIHGNNLLFLANDYTLYAYDKSTGNQKWNTDLHYKTRQPCFVGGNAVFVNYYDYKNNYTARLDLATGKLEKILPIGPLQTQPVFRDGILYGTALYDAGNIFAYDTKKDSMLWYRFIAHGISTQPYYFNDFIRANAESNNWFDIGYDGKLKDTICKNKADIFVRDIPCIRKFFAQTHDGYPMDEKFFKKVFGGEIEVSVEKTLAAPSNSFVLLGEQLAIIGKKGKLVKLLEIPTLVAEDKAESEEGLTGLITADEHTLWFVYNDQLISYDLSKLQTRKIIDLSAYEPYQVVPDGSITWLVSRKDGCLYGLSE